MALNVSLNVSLTPHLEEFVCHTVSTGRFRSPSEVVRTALRLLEERERERQARLDWLRREINKGLASGPATRLNMREVKRRARQRRKSDGPPPA